MGKIVFSDEISIYEINNNEEEIFQEMDAEIKKLELYVKKLKNLYLGIYIDEFYFKKIEVEIEKDDVLAENLEKYMEYSVKEFLDEESVENYFIKYFEISEGLYEVFIFERDFIEELIEFIIKNKLKIENIYIKDKNSYTINDYDSLIKRKSDIVGLAKYIFLVFLFIFVFLGIKFYNSKLENKKDMLNKNIIEKEEEVKKIKKDLDLVEKEISNLNEKIKESTKSKEYFEDKIYRILKIMPENMVVENIYFEKNIFTIKGKSYDEESLFEFLNIFENDDKIEKVVYDYIVKKENIYEFFGIKGEVMGDFILENKKLSIFVLVAVIFYFFIAVPLERVFENKKKYRNKTKKIYGNIKDRKNYKRKYKKIRNKKRRTFKNI